ncbi:MAG: bifunctional lysine-specific demethylase and histidyl-hydroxylase [Actinomycetota bacterium]|nr:bifunctional lysine-specific demethylase and histidyl-hydroxylase [Actinomycetota bacterium]
MLSLEKCVGDVRAFERDHWAKRPLLNKRAAEAPSPFADVARLADLDHVITSLNLRLPSFRMVRDGKPIPVGGFTKSERKRSGTVDAVIDPSAVFDRFNEGATIVIEGLHKYWNPLTRFSRELEMELGHRIQINAYITPPGSQGFAVHRDDHDVFVLQITGSKHWMVYDENDETDVLIEDDLNEGDALYIPKGFPHAATTTDDTSAHLTVGILTHDEIDIVREVMKMAEEDPAFRERLSLRPTDGPEFDDSALGIVEGFQRWVEKLDRDELLWRVKRRLTTTQQELSSGQLERLVRLSDVDDDTVVRRRAGATSTVGATAGRLRVLLTDRELEMPAEVEIPMSFIARTESFVVADLAPWLEPSSRLVLVRRLIREGLLEAVFDG